MEINENNANGIVILVAGREYKVVKKGNSWYFKNLKSLREFEQPSFTTLLNIIHASKIYSRPKPKIYEVW